MVVSVLPWKLYIGVLHRWWALFCGHYFAREFQFALVRAIARVYAYRDSWQALCEKHRMKPVLLLLSDWPGEMYVFVPESARMGWQMYSDFLPSKKNGGKMLQISILALVRFSTVLKFQQVTTKKTKEQFQETEKECVMNKMFCCYSVSEQHIRNS